MKKLFALFVSFVLLVIGTAFAEVVRTDDAVVFLGAVDQLKHINSRESVEDAQQIFKGITSNYNQSNLFAIYASAIIDIYDGRYDDAQTKIDVLSMNDSFIKLLEKYELQSCNVLQQYIEGRRMEDAGDYQGALAVYATMNFLDSPERMIAIMGDAKEQTYEEAQTLFDVGAYKQAAEVFRSLGNYKDSAEMVEKASALIPTPSPTPEPTPTPRPTETPIVTPAPLLLDERAVGVNPYIYYLQYQGNNGVLQRDKDHYRLAIDLESEKQIDASTYLSDCYVSWADTTDDYSSIVLLNEDAREKIINGRTGFVGQYLDKSVYNFADSKEHFACSIYVPSIDIIEGEQTISFVFSRASQSDYMKIDFKILIQKNKRSYIGWDMQVADIQIWQLS